MRIIGRSPSLTRALHLAWRVAPYPISVLIEGESGTGKELFALNIHRLSSRSDGPFVAVDAAACPLELLESELFGHVRGAFTGADADRPGRLAMAQGGTLFLDGAGNLPLEIQVKLLRVLEQRRLIPLGSHKGLDLDLRLIVASQGSLRERVSQGAFREDLYHRVHEFSLTLSPLRQRREDIPLLCDYFLGIFNQHLNKRISQISPAVMGCFLRHAWPGNIRELMNVLRRAMLLAEDKIEEEHLPLEFHYTKPSVLDALPAGVLPLWKAGSLVAENIEKTNIFKALEAAGGDRKLAAKELKLHVKTLSRKIKRWGL